MKAIGSTVALLVEACGGDECPPPPEGWEYLDGGCKGAVHRDTTAPPDMYPTEVTEICPEDRPKTGETFRWWPDSDGDPYGGRDEEIRAANMDAWCGTATPSPATTPNGIGVAGFHLRCHIVGRQP